MIPRHPTARAADTSKGYCPPAQGWTEDRGPTLGNAAPIALNPNGVVSSWPPPDGDTTPLGLARIADGVSQGSSCLATLGWVTKRRWRLPTLDALVGKVEAAVERLQEYRTALITAAVTGKIDVRQAALDGGGG